MAKRPILTELRSVDVALAPLSPSRELDGRIDALLAGRRPRTAQRRVLVAAFSACAAVAAVTVWLGRAGDDAIALGRVPEAQQSPLLEEPRALDRSPEIGGAPTTLPVASPDFGGGALRRRVQPREGAAGLALIEGAPPDAAPSAPLLRARPAALDLPAPAESTAALATTPRREVKSARTPRAALVARAAADTPEGDAHLEDALAALRADKARGDLRGAVARIDALLASDVGPRAATILRVERAHLQERLGDRGAACAGLAGLGGDDAHDARARLSCP